MADRNYGRLLVTTFVALCVAACSPAERGAREIAPNGPNGLSADDSDAASLMETSADGRVTLNEAAPSTTESGAPEMVPGELLVKFRARTTRAGITTTLSKVAHQSSRRYASQPALVHVKLAPGEDLTNAIATYEQDASVEYVEPNYIVRTHAIPNDERFATQWGLHNTGQTGVTGVPDTDIDAPEAWDITTGDANLVVAVVDSGVDYTHPDLASNVFSNTAECDADGVDDDGNGYVDDCHGIDPLNGDADPHDDNGHGTHVAGIIGASANNGIGIAGVAWNVRILPCKFIGPDGSGTTSDAIACLDYIAALKARGVNVVATNNSWGGGLRSESLRQAIEAQRQAGILFVTSAGNSGADHDAASIFPCNYDAPNIVCVAAFTAANIKPGFSDYGRRTVHVGAPGFSVLSTMPNSSYASQTGTSMAAPHVAGVAVLLKANDPARDWRVLKNLIIAGGEVVNAMEPTISGRRLSAHGSLTCSNAIVRRRLRPAADFVPMKRIGYVMTLRMLNINCAQPNGALTVNVAPGGETIALVDDGTGADEAANDGVYSATWTAATAGTHTLMFPDDDSVTIDIDATLEPGFPVQTLHLGGSYLSGPGITTLVGNIDADPQFEIVRTALASGPLYAWNHDGTRVPGWPRTVLEVTDEYAEIGGAGYPVLGNFAGGSDRLEVFSTYSWLFKAAYTGNGELLPGWPLDTYSQVPGSAFDIDGDGIDEIFSEDNDNYTRAWIDGYDANGVSLPGWPRVTPPQSVPGKFYTPAHADLDGDGVAEVIGTDGAFIHVYHHDGTLAAGFPLSIGSGSYPAIGDVDGDGAPEIIVRSRRQDSTHFDDIHIVSSTGVVERTIQTSYTNPYFPAPALADLTGDGIPEIILQANNGVGVYRGDGTSLPGWPKTIIGWRTNSSPVVGDIDGDSAPDIAFTMQVAGDSGNGVLHAYSSAGTALTGFPKPMQIGGGAVPAIADVDNDGRNELVVSGAYWNGYRGEYDTVWVFDLGGSAHGPIEWGQMMNDERHSGFYKLGKNLPNEAFLAVQAHGTGSVTSVPSGIDCGNDCLQKFPRNQTVVLTASGAGFSGWRGACANQSNPCTVAVSDYTSVVAEFGTAPLTVSLKPGSEPGAIVSNPAGIDCGSDCTENFPLGTLVTLTAVPTSTTYFVGWTGACIGASPTCTVAMNAARSARAEFRMRPLLEVTLSETGTGRVTSTPAGIDCGTDCSEYFLPTTSVTLTATPGPGSTFGGWSSIYCVEMNPVCTLPAGLSQDIFVSFIGPSPRPVTVTKTGTGTGRVHTDVPGIDCGTECSADFQLNTSVRFYATASPGSRFVGWSGDCSGTDSICYISISRARNVIARFDTVAPTYELTASRLGSGSGRIVSAPAGIDCGGGDNNCSETYAEGTQVTLTAIPWTGVTFVGWSGACTGSSTTCVVSMTAARSVGATFEPIPPSYPLSVGRIGTGSASAVVSVPSGISCGADCGESYVSGTTVTLTANVASGETFAGWSDACTGTALQCVVTMNSERRVTATFVRLLPLTVSIGGTGSGRVTLSPSGVSCGSDCTGQFAPNTLVTLTAVAEPGSTFEGWSGACAVASRTAGCTIAMSASMSVGASFMRQPDSGGSSGGGSSGGGNSGGSSGGGSGGGSSSGGKGGGGELNALFGALLLLFAGSRRWLPARNRALRNPRGSTSCASRPAS